MNATTGERCPACWKTKSKIIDTRMEKGYRKRRGNAYAAGPDGAQLKYGWRRTEDEQIVRAMCIEGKVY